MSRLGANFQASNRVDFKKPSRFQSLHLLVACKFQESYTLEISGYFGGLGTEDGFEQNNGQKFSTFDRDNDSFSNGHCAVSNTGAWWYRSCGQSNFNGAGIKLGTWRSHSLRSVQMSIRA